MLELYDGLPLPPATCLACTNHAAEADVAGGGVDHFRVACGRAEALAVVQRTQVRAALQHLAADLHLWLRGIKAVLEPGTAGVANRAA